MKIIMGITQAVAGIIIFGIIVLFMLISIGSVITNEAIEKLKKVNKGIKTNKEENENE